MNQQLHLIFVEGVPFTGKSTTSEYIATQLQLNGHRAHWVSEGMLLQRYFPHVVEVFDRQRPFSETRLRAEWSGFMEAVLAAETVFVVDSALSYAAVDPCLIEDWPVEAIHAELGRIAELCTPLQPHVIHLVGDVEYLVPASIAERGEGWREHLIRQSDAMPYQQARGRSGLAGATIMMHETQSLMDTLLAGGGWPTLTLDVTGSDRALHQRAILGFLGLSQVVVEQLVLEPSVLRSYAGTYATHDPERSDTVLSIQLEGDALVVSVPGMRYGRLIPISATRFHLQATPLDMEFVVEEGQTQQLMLFVSNGKTYTYRRV